jgi:hypothetical protein
LTFLSRFAPSFFNDKITKKKGLVCNNIKAKNTLSVRLLNTPVTSSNGSRRKKTEVHTNLHKNWTIKAIERKDKILEE